MNAKIALRIVFTHFKGYFLKKKPHNVIFPILVPVCCSDLGGSDYDEDEGKKQNGQKKEEKKEEKKPDEKEKPKDAPVAPPPH